MKKILIGLWLAIFCFGVLFTHPVFADELRILTWEGYAPKKHIDAFKKLIKKKYGTDLDIKISYINDVEDIYKSLRNREADIVTPSNNLPKDARFKYMERNLVLPIESGNISNYKDLIKQLKNTKYFSEKGTLYGIPFAYGGYGLAYNTALFDEPPKTWKIFWDPAYAGKYAISSTFYDANIYITALALGVGKNDIYKYDAVYSKELFNDLKNLTKNAGTIYSAISDADDLYNMSIAACWGFSFSELKKRGQTWKMAFPREGTTAYLDGWMISHTLKDKPKLKRIAEEWIDYVISPDFQVDIVVRTLGAFPVNTSIIHRLSMEEVETFHMNDPEFFKKSFIPWEILDNRTRKGFKLLWKKVMP